MSFLVDLGEKNQSVDRDIGTTEFLVQSVQIYSTKYRNFRLVFFYYVNDANKVEARISAREMCTYSNTPFF